MVCARRIGSWLLLAALLSVGLGFGQTAQAQSGNLVQNGDFASGTAYWNLIGDVGTETCCAYGNNSYPGGSYPNAYAHPNGAGSNFALWQDLGIQPAGNYTLSGWIRTSGGTQQTLIQADTGTQPYCLTPWTNTSVWQRFTCTFTLSGPSPVHVALVTSNAPATAWGWISWDSSAWCAAARRPAMTSRSTWAAPAAATTAPTRLPTTRAAARPCKSSGAPM